MHFRDFNRFWRVKQADEDAACQAESIVTFVRSDTGDQLSVHCAQIPYDRNTASYNPSTNTIDVKFGGKDYVIRMGGTCEKPTITFAEKSPGRGPLTGSWTAEDYVPGSPPEPAGE